MATSLDQLLYGIRQVESGGNYSVVNSIGAVGAYQVMKANIPSWTKRALGYSMTWQQFRNSRSAQDTVARVILGGYYKKYGAAGAASMWFSGQPNPNKTTSDGYNTVRQYVSKVLAASGGGSIAGTSGGGSTYTVEAAVPQLTNDERAEQYGLSMRLINSSKELKKVFQQAVAGGWSAARFQAALKNTGWWRTQSDTLRKYVTLKITDPATWKQNFDATAAKLNQLAVQVGLGNQIFQAGKGKGQANGLLKQAVYNSLALGWSDARIKDWLGSRVTMHGGTMWGEAGDAFDKLHELAYANGRKYSDYWYRANVRSVMAGQKSLEQLQGQIRSEAAAQYSAFAEQIKAGVSAMDLAAPYIKSVSELLELPETDVDLSNPHVIKAMTAKGAAGAQMPLWQFENAVRADPLWRKTNNARENMFAVAHQVAKDFGVVF